MKLQDLSIEQLQEIVDGAPEGAEYYAPRSKRYYVAHFGYSHNIKLSDIRNRIAEPEKLKNIKPKFNIGEWVVSTLSGKKLWHLDVCKIEGFHKTIAITKCSTGMIHHRLQQMRHAAPAEIAAGHRIDETEEELLAESEVWRECREPCRFDRLEVEPANGWAINPTRNKVCIEEETPELFESKHCSPRPMVDRELNVSVGQKHDQSKPRYSLIPSGSLASIVDVLEYGANKYAPDNWKQVENARERYYNASMRHIQAWWSGEQIDSESGLPHLAHAICSLMFLMALDGEQGE